MFNWIQAAKDRFHQLDFFTRAVYLSTLLILFLLMIFIPLRYFREEYNLLAINIFLAIIISLVNLLLLSGRIKLAQIIYIVTIYVMMFVAVSTIGHTQISWLYPASSMLFFSMPPKRALLVTTSLMILVSLAMIGKVSYAYWFQVVASVQTSLIIVYMFCNRLNAKIDKLDVKASIDFLSGLRNRGSFEETLKQVKPDGENTPYLAIIDIDFFKNINDFHGHIVGDKIISDLGDRLNKSIRSTDRAFRIGGEEFALIVSTSTISNFLATLERLNKSLTINPYVSNQNSEIPYTVSIGVAVYNSDFDLWHQSADEALYKAKQNGRNNIVVYEHEKNISDFSRGIQL